LQQLKSFFRIQQQTLGQVGRLEGLEDRTSGSASMPSDVTCMEVPSVSPTPSQSVTAIRAIALRKTR
jgi:hypothetical protein